MINIAVLKYQFVSDKPVGIPNEWPAETIELGENTNLPSEDWVLMTQIELETHKAIYKSAYDSWLQTYSTPNIENLISKRITNAMSFGNKLIVEYGTKNVLRGYTVQQTRSIAFKLLEVQSLLLSGSLYCAREALFELTPDNLVTQADIDEFMAKINTYLGV